MIYIENHVEEMVPLNALWKKSSLPLVKRVYFKTKCRQLHWERTINDLKGSRKYSWHPWFLSCHESLFQGQDSWLMLLQNNTALRYIWVQVHDIFWTDSSLSYFGWTEIQGHILSVAIIDFIETGHRTGITVLKSFKTLLAVSRRSRLSNPRVVHTKTPSLIKCQKSLFIHFWVLHLPTSGDYQSTEENSG